MTCPKSIAYLATTCALLALCLLAAASPVCAQERDGVIVFFEVAPAAPERGDIDICAQFLTTAGQLAWSSAGAPLPVATSPHREAAPVACADGAGGAIVVYTVEFVDGDYAGDVDLYAQRLSPEGEILWVGGKQLASSGSRETNPVLIPDGQGGAIVVYEWADEDGDVDIMAQRINAQGQLLWNAGERPSIVAASTGVERNSAVVSDGEGGIIAVFEWVGAGGNVDVMAQRLSHEGTPQWTVDDRAVDVAATSMHERTVAALPDGRGGVFAVFELEFIKGTYQGDVDIMAQHISAQGALLWNEGGEPIVVSSGNGIEGAPCVVSDDTGGMVVFLTYEPREGEHAGDEDILAQRIDAAGSRLWKDGRSSVPVGTSQGLERNVRALANARAGAFAVFEFEFLDGEHIGDVDVFAQRILLDGSLAWNEGKKSVMAVGSTWIELRPVVVPDGQGGLIVVCEATGPEGDVDIRAQRLSPGGELLWQDGERSVSVAATSALERNLAAVFVQAP